MVLEREVLAHTNTHLAVFPGSAHIRDVVGRFEMRQSTNLDLKCNSQTVVIMFFFFLGTYWFRGSSNV